MTTLPVEKIIELAQEIEVSDPVDWGSLPVDPSKIYQIIASQTCELYGELDPQDREAVLLATTIKLLVENFTLNLQLNQH